MVHGPAEHDPGQAGDEPDGQELDRVGPGDAALRQPEHAQHRAVVEMAAGEVARADAHRHSRQQGREKRHQVEELLRPVQRLPHLGPAGLERLHAHAAQRRGRDAVLDLAHEARHRRVGSRHRETPVDAAGGLHQAGGGQVVAVQHHARREAHEAGAAVGLDRDQARDRHRAVAEQQAVTEREPE